MNFIHFVEKIYLYVKGLSKPKYELLINRRENLVVRPTKNPKVFIDYSQTFDDFYRNLEDYNQTKEIKVLTLIRLDFLRVVFPWGGVNLTPPHPLHISRRTYLISV